MIVKKFNEQSNKQKYLKWSDIINSYKELNLNWDSYGADKIADVAINKAIIVLDNLYKLELLNKLTSISPMNDGGIQFDFDVTPYKQSELEVKSNGNFNYLEYDSHGNLEVEKSDIPYSDINLMDLLNN